MSRLICGFVIFFAVIATTVQLNAEYKATPSEEKQAYAIIGSLLGLKALGVDLDSQPRENIQAIWKLAGNEWIYNAFNHVWQGFTDMAYKERDLDKATYVTSDRLKELGYLGYGEKLADEKRASAVKVAAAQEKATAAEKSAAEKVAAAEKSAAEKVAAVEKAAKEKGAAAEKAAQEKAAAAEKAGEEKAATAEKSAAEKVAAAEKKATAAEGKATAAERKAAVAKKAVAVEKAAEEKKGVKALSLAQLFEEGIQRTGIIIVAGPILKLKEKKNSLDGKIESIEMSIGKGETLKGLIGEKGREIAVITENLSTIKTKKLSIGQVIAVKGVCLLSSDKYGVIRGEVITENFSILAWNKK